MTEVMDAQTFRSLLPKAKRQPEHIESRIQSGFVRVARIQYPILKKLLFAIPNGGKRGGKRNRQGVPIEAKIMKGEGVTAGVADLFLSVPIPGCPGLYLETKKPGEGQSPDQREFEQAVTEQGYQYRVYQSVEEGLRILNEYMAQRKK